MDADSFATHRVENQPPPFEPADLWVLDPLLRLLVELHGADWARERLAAYGALAGGEILALSWEAERDRPRLRTHDRFGHRIDRVEYHPAYHRIMQLAVEHGLSNLPWREPRPGAEVARAALVYLHHQAEAGTNCPLTMSFAGYPVLARDPFFGEWTKKLLAPAYDPSDRPIAEKAGITLGMGMTEKQGGSDVRANSTRAEPLADGRSYRLIGHKWFFSAPMSDGFLVLAQAPGGLSCFLLPRWLENGTRNAIRIQRLKDKVGNRSNASSEVEFEGALAYRVGEEGRGVATILEMVALTRIDCALGAAAEMRMALAQAVHHARHRKAFGHRLIDQPLMRAVLADLALEWMAALAFALHIVAWRERAADDGKAAKLARLGIPVAKYWLCKRAPAFVNEAQECLGGAGYVEESLLARLYREAPLNSIWEGCGNIQCLDVLRVLEREPEALPIWLEFAGGDGCAPALARWLEMLPSLAQAARRDPALARRLSEALALAMQAHLLAKLEAADERLAVAAHLFVESRLNARRSGAFGDLPAGADHQACLDLVLPPP